MKRLSLGTLICLLLLFAAAWPVSAEKTYLADRFETRIEVQPDGRLLVTETVSFRFLGGPFTYVFREVSRNRTDGIEILEASLDGNLLVQGASPGEFEVENGDPIQVTWHFAPTSDSVHAFGLTYRVVGAIRHEADVDALDWQAIPPRHEYTIQQGLIQIQYPAVLVLLATPQISASPTESDLSAGRVVFVTGEIPPDIGLVASLRFPSGSLVQTAPAWQAEEELNELQGENVRKALPIGLALGLFSALASLVGIIAAARSFRRAEGVGTAPQPFSINPPGPVSPGLVARLTHSTTGYLGTLFDLARRGVVEIVEGPMKWGARQYDVVRLPSSEYLRPHEQAFMKALFTRAKQDRVELSEIAGLAANREFNQSIEAEISAAGWKDEERSQKRNRFLLISGLGLMFAFALFMSGFVLVGVLDFSQEWVAIMGVALLGLGAGLGGSSFIGLVVAATISTLSIQGIRVSSAWNGFMGSMQNITRQRDPGVSPDLFERYLPYAAGFGMATEWAKTFQGIAGVPIPAWFQALQSSLDDGSFGAIISAVTAADASASVASGADGGGASGGGSSGAG
jgi:hypothetical protein